MNSFKSFNLGFLWGLILKLTSEEQEEGCWLLHTGEGESYNSLPPSEYKENGRYL